MRSVENKALPSPLFRSRNVNNLITPLIVIASMRGVNEKLQHVREIGTSPNNEKSW
jgi:hypothetical protein